MCQQRKTVSTTWCWASEENYTWRFRGGVSPGQVTTDLFKNVYFSISLSPVFSFLRYIFSLLLKIVTVICHFQFWGDGGHHWRGWRWWIQQCEEQSVILDWITQHIVYLIFVFLWLRCFFFYGTDLHWRVMWKMSQKQQSRELQEQMATVMKMSTYQ